MQPELLPVLKQFTLSRERLSGCHQDGVHAQHPQPAGREAASDLPELEGNATRWLAELYICTPTDDRPVQNKNTGSLSGAMFNLNFTACCIRVFTSWAEGAGATMLRAYCLTGLLHGTTAAQIAYYSPEQKGTGSTARSSRTKAKAKVT